MGKNLTELEEKDGNPVQGLIVDSEIKLFD